MKRLIVAAALALAVSGAVAVGGASAGATHNQFDGIFFLTNPCNGEFTVATGPVKIVFDLSGHGEAVSKGGAPNFGFDLGIRVFVAGGVPTGAFFIAPFSSTCHG